jgi:hypothetical protein
VYRKSIFCTSCNTGKLILLRDTWHASGNVVPLGAESCSCVRQAGSMSCVVLYKILSVLSNVTGRRMVFRYTFGKI